MKLTKIQTIIRKTLSINPTYNAQMVKNWVGNNIKDPIKYSPPVTWIRHKVTMFGYRGLSNQMVSLGIHPKGKNFIGRDGDELLIDIELTMSTRLKLAFYGTICAVGIIRFKTV